MLADESWSNPARWMRVAVAWRRYGSTFLLSAILLNIVGGTVPSIQQIDMASKVAQVPMGYRSYQTFDMPDLQTHSYPYSQDNNLISILTRNALKSATNSPFKPQAQL